MIKYLNCYNCKYKGEYQGTTQKKYEFCSRWGKKKIFWGTTTHFARCKMGRVK